MVGESKSRFTQISNQSERGEVGGGGGVIIANSNVCSLMELGERQGDEQKGVGHFRQGLYNQSIPCSLASSIIRQTGRAPLQLI